MRRIVTSMILSFILLSGSGVAFAQHGHGRPHGNGHYSGKHHGRPIRYRHRPTPPPPRHHYHHGPMHPPVNLGHMVAYLTRGCSDVAVWQIDYDTYIVKYRRGNRLYTQQFYPYYDEYASPSRISVGWRPSSPWNLIPSINLNINI